MCILIAYLYVYISARKDTLNFIIVYFIIIFVNDLNERYSGIKILIVLLFFVFTYEDIN